MTKMIRLQAAGVANLSFDELELPALKENEVKIQVKAAGITGDNLKFINNHSPNDGPHQAAIYPALLGYEAAGIVTEVGPKVSKDWLQKRVAPVGPFDSLKYGVLGTEAIVPADRLVEIPANLSFELAAALWVPFLTAYPVYSLGNIQKNDFVLITAGTSAVGVAAIQIVQALGGIPIATTRSATKAVELKELTQVKYVITDSKKLADEVDRITGGKGVKVVFDSIGGETILEIAQAASYQGLIIEYGVIGGLHAPLPVAELIGKGLSIKGYSVSEVVNDKLTRERASHYVLENLAKGLFKPAINQIFEMGDFQAAFKAVKENQNIGRIILKNN